ncbi:MAG TPA: hypothetical protein VKH19_03320 [Gemmatimonadaceae bacterium]|nr:hypothetical protein [Gemmatimonadaceae bacterium]
MKPTGTTDQIVQLFERELRAVDGHFDDLPPKRPGVRISQELHNQVVEYAGDVRTRGRTPEQMLVELKTVLTRAAPEVDSVRRSVLLAELTGRAIHAFFRR